MDTLKYMIIIKGEFKTKEISSCELDRRIQKYKITYNTGKTYLYSYKNVVIMHNPTILRPHDYIVETLDGKSLLNIIGIYEFEINNYRDNNEKY